MAVSKQPPITPETSSGEGIDDEISSRGEARWKRFHPLRVVRKIFRRRIKREGTPVSDSSKKSWSTSELQSVEDDASEKCEVTSPLKIGLSVSHDSIFSPESNVSGMGSETLSVPHGSSLTIHQASIKNMFKDELFSRIRARRDSDDDDLGLPHSPCTSPTTVDVLTQGLKEKSSKSQTTCSAGSLISMGSSENDEDSTGHSSSHSSRMSLMERRSLDLDGDLNLNQSASIPLNHNAAHHKIAVKPKRKHGLPRRRMNQIGASKLVTLPTTPEVAEDNGKSIQKLESIEIIQQIQEFSSTSEKEIISMQSSELKVVHTSVSCNEMSELTESLIQDKTSSDSNVHLLKRQQDYDSKTYIDDKHKKNTFKTSLEKTRHFDVIGNDDISKTDTIENKAISSNDYKLSFMEQEDEVVFNEIKCDETLIFEAQAMNSKLHKAEKHSSILLSESLQSQVEEAIKVSSLVRNIERKESFKSTEKSPQPNDETIEYKNKLSNNGENNLFLKSNENVEGFKETDQMRDNFKQVSLNSSIIKSSDTISTIEPNDCANIAKVIHDSNKLNMDCEFILKPMKKNVTSEIDQMEFFNENKAANDKLSPTCLEKESINNTTLSMDVEEGGIFVSHHALVPNDLKDILVTEAHNYAAVDENKEVHPQNYFEKNESLELEDKDSWIGSVGISVSKPDVTVSSSSTICNSKVTEDKITISVNSNHSIKQMITSQSKNLEQIKEPLKSTSSKPELNQRITVKEVSSVKPLLKSNLSDLSTTSNVKNINTQKRVSVEIVPFSQRMKERKYQPLGLNSKEAIVDKEKKICNTSVERKLSDRKVVSKTKDVEKASNRHSFSGVISSDKKDVISDKKQLKLEKMHYPVQIRIHKSLPSTEHKDKNTKVSSNKDNKNALSKNILKNEQSPASPKTKQKDIKSMKDKQTVENAKWEVKIQPASINSNIQQNSKVDESFSLIGVDRNLTSLNELQHFSVVNENKEISLNQELESSFKSNEAISRTTKDTTVPSDEPEPELLRVFARRSIKQKHCDKDKPNDIEEKSVLDVSSEEPPITNKMKDNNETISVLQNSTVIKISEISKPHIKSDLRKKSKSFSEKERTTTRSASPLKEMNLIHKESPANLSLDVTPSNESTHPRQRVVNVPDVPLNLPPDMMKNFQYESKIEQSFSNKEETHQKSSLNNVSQTVGSVNGNLAVLGTVKENQEILNGKEGHAPSWLQLAQQRRELREQRERLLLGGSPNSFMDASNKPARSSKVWDMVNNFQKLQMT